MVSKHQKNDYWVRVKNLFHQNHKLMIQSCVFSDCWTIGFVSVQHDEDMKSDQEKHQLQCWPGTCWPQRCREQDWSEPASSTTSPAAWRGWHTWPPPPWSVFSPSLMTFLDLQGSQRSGLARFLCRSWWHLVAVFQVLASCSFCNVLSARWRSQIVLVWYWLVDNLLVTCSCSSLLPQMTARPCPSQLQAQADPC